MRTLHVIVLLFALLWSRVAGAVDGVIEINQVRASAGGITSGDTAGFPVTISQSGSYRLTSNLSVSDPNIDAIQIAAGSVQIDLNGFGIRGPNMWAGGNADCTASGSGHGIFAGPPHSGIVVLNGNVVGAGAGGIALMGTNARVERVIVEQNCSEGIRVGDGSLVTDSTASRNRGNGFMLGATNRLTGSIADRNQIAGVTFANQGYLTIESCVASGNGHDGIVAGIRSTIQGNQVNNNGVNGIIADAGSLVLDNVVYGHIGMSVGISGVGSGGNVVNYSAGTGYTGVTRVHCDLDNATKVCP